MSEAVGPAAALPGPPAAAPAAVASAAAPASSPGPLAAGASTAPPPRCSNCGAGVPGRFCAVCGQRLEAPIHSLGHFARIATEDFTHADSRLWRTLLALLMRPGHLTREFLSGRRASYLPPVRLYLVLSVVFFLWAAATQSHNVIVIDPDEPATAQHRAAPAPADSAAATAQTPVQRAEQECANLDYDGPWHVRLQPLLRGACVNTLKDNGRSLSEAFLHNLPHAMFLFLPVFAGAMMMLYWHPRRYYVEHLLFLVHNHAFAFAFFMLVWALSGLVPRVGPLIALAGTFYFPWYMYRAMRTVYGQGRARTFAKLALLSFLYLLSGSLMLALTSLYSVYSILTV